MNILLTRYHCFSNAPLTRFHYLFCSSELRENEFFQINMDEIEDENQGFSEPVNSEGLDDWMQEIQSQFPSAQIEVVHGPRTLTTTAATTNGSYTESDALITQECNSHQESSNDESSKVIVEGESYFQEEEVESLEAEELLFHDLFTDHSYNKSPLLKLNEEADLSVATCSKYLDTGTKSFPQDDKNRSPRPHNETPADDLLEPDLDFLPESEEVNNSSSSTDDNVLELENEESRLDTVVAEEEVTLGRVIKKRKKKGSKEEWADNKNKRLRQHGKDYVGWSKEGDGTKKRGKERKSRELGPRCQGPGCLKSYRTCNDISDQDRATIFKDFWEHFTWSQKQTYVASLVQRVQKKTIKNPENKSRREATLKYTIKTPDGKEHSVCKTFFLNTFALGDWTVRQWAADSAEENKPKRGHGITPPTKAIPKRGLGESNPRGKAKLIEFFDSLPKLPAHYCRRDTSKLYIEPIFGNRMSDVYAEYVKQCANEVVPIKPLSTYTFYRLAENQNLAFQIPKKDRCDTCVAHDAGLINEIDYNEHVRLKERARQEKTLDKEKAIAGTHFVVTQDVQAVKVCPSLNASALYFKTKLACHNFSIFNMKTHEARCYWFNETQADLTAPTFASCLIDFLLDKWDKNLKPPIIIWSDGCTSQNRNAILANALLSFSSEYGVEITQKFLEKGHTQMEVDSIHAIIENKIHNQPIHLPSDFVRLAASARSKPCPIEQKELSYSFTKNFAQQELLMYDSIRPGRKTGDPVVTDIRTINYKSGEIKIQIKSFDSNFIKLPQRKRRSVVSKLSQFKQCHLAPLKITKRKWTHLQELKSVIPQDCHPFYDSLHYE